MFPQPFPSTQPYNVCLYYDLYLSQAALKAARQTKDGRDEEIATLRSELEVKYTNYADPKGVCFVIRKNY